MRERDGLRTLSHKDTLTHLYTNTHAYTNTHTHAHTHTQTHTQATPTLTSPEWHCTHTLSLFHTHTHTPTGGTHRDVARGTLGAALMHFPALSHTHPTQHSHKNINSEFSHAREEPPEPEIVFLSAA